MPSFNASSSQRDSSSQIDSPDPSPSPIASAFYPPASALTASTTQAPPSAPTPSTTLNIIHFNDVYEIAERDTEPCGGAPRFAHAVKRLRAAAAATGSPSLVLFSGDALSPSLIATMTRGTHMVRVLNALGVGAACLGNHDLDHGIEGFEAVARQNTFPWLVSNAREAAGHGLGRPLGGVTVEAAVVEPGGGWRVGIVGLIEKAWLDTLSTLPPSAVDFEEAAVAAARLSAALRGAGRCNLVIALTHMRLPNDRRLAAAAAQAGSLDLILGGHDHEYSVDLGDADAGSGTSSVPIVKSGSDFRTLSLVRVGYGLPGQAMFPPPVPPVAPDAPVGVGGVFLGSTTHVRRGSVDALPLTVDVRSFEISRAEPVDAAMEAIVNSFADAVGRQLESIVGVARTPLDARFATLRTCETTAGNFVADLMRQSTGADVAVLNSGTLRADAVLGPGLLRAKDLVALLPMQDSIVVLRMPGRVLLAALENAVSAWPAREGRFAQVSGIRFGFDPTRPPGARVLRESVKVLKRRRVVDSQHNAAAHGTTTAAVVATGADAAASIAMTGGVQPARASLDLFPSAAATLVVPKTGLTETHPAPSAVAANAAIGAATGIDETGGDSTSDDELGDAIDVPETEDDTKRHDSAAVSHSTRVHGGHGVRAMNHAALIAAVMSPAARTPSLFHFSTGQTRHGYMSHSDEGAGQLDGSTNSIDAVAQQMRAANPFTTATDATTTNVDGGVEPPHTPQRSKLPAADDAAASPCPPPAVAESSPRTAATTPLQSPAGDSGLRLIAIPGLGYWQTPGGIKFPVAELSAPPIEGHLALPPPRDASAAFSMRRAESAPGDLDVDAAGALDVGRREFTLRSSASSAADVGCISALTAQPEREIVENLDIVPAGNAGQPVMGHFHHGGTAHLPNPSDYLVSPSSGAVRRRRQSATAASAASTPHATHQALESNGDAHKCGAVDGTSEAHVGFRPNHAAGSHVSHHAAHARHTHSAVKRSMWAPLDDDAFYTVATKSCECRLLVGILNVSGTRL